MAKEEVSPNLLIKVGFAVAGYFVIVKPLLEWLGLKEDKTDKANETSLQTVLGWSPLYYKEVSKKGLKTTYLTSAGATMLAKQIKNAWGGLLNDNEEQVYGALKMINSWVKLSQVAEKYYLLYGEDLGREIKARLSDDEFYTVTQIVNTYKKY